MENFQSVDGFLDSIKDDRFGNSLAFVHEVSLNLRAPVVSNFSILVCYGRIETLSFSTFEETGKCSSQVIFQGRLIHCLNGLCVHQELAQLHKVYDSLILEVFKVFL